MVWEARESFQSDENAREGVFGPSQRVTRINLSCRLARGYRRSDLSGEGATFFEYSALVRVDIG